MSYLLQPVDSFVHNLRRFGALRPRILNRLTGWWGNRLTFRSLACPLFQPDPRRNRRPRDRQRPCAQSKPGTPRQIDADPRARRGLRRQWQPQQGKRRWNDPRFRNGGALSSPMGCAAPGTKSGLPGSSSMSGPLASSGTCHSPGAPKSGPARSIFTAPWRLRLCQHTGERRSEKRIRDRTIVAGQPDVMLIGATGKSHLAIAIALIRNGIRGCFFTVVDLVNRLDTEPASACRGAPPVL